MNAGGQSRAVFQRLVELIATSTGACAVCGALTADPAERFCGGDRCGRVFMPRPEYLGFRKSLEIPGC
jgi:hypothetical protein